MKKLMMLALIAALAGTPVMAHAEDGAAVAGKEHPKMDPEKREKMKERWQQHLKEVDKNGDGAVDKDEFVAQAEKRFGEMDANSDGKITPEERKAAHEKMRAKFREFKGGDGEGRGGRPDGPPPEGDAPPPPAGE